jgi:hypothetical protein
MNVCDHAEKQGKTIAKVWCEHFQPLSSNQKYCRFYRQDIVDESKGKHVCDCCEKERK